MSDNRDQKTRGPRKPGGAGKGGPRKSGGDAPRKAPGKFAAKPGGRFAGDKAGAKPGAKRFGDRPPRRDGDAPARAERRFDKPFEKKFDTPRSDKPRLAKPRRVLREPQSAPSAFEGERIAKVMARVGLCSRRDAEAWIEQGRVVVNGEVLKSAAVNVTPDDRVIIDGKPLAARERTRLFMFHKPRGLVTTDHDPEGRPTIFDALPDNLPRLMSIGRLDINTEGLLLLTNDGGLARVLELPSTGWLRRYRVRANGVTDQAQLDALREGVSIDGVDYAGIEAHLDRVQGANVWISMGLREGKNREIKRVLEHLGLAVNRLIRLSFGPFQLGELAEGEVDEVRTRVLMDQIGPALAQEAGADFESAIVDRTPAPDVDPDARPGRKPRGKPAPVRGYEEEAERPRKDRPAPAPRKHVSVLRAAAPAKGGNEKTVRRRIERAETADRKGRTVNVERIVAPSSQTTGTRNARRFATERDGTSGERPRTGRNAKDAPKRLDRRGEKPRAFTRDAGDAEAPREFKPRAERSAFKPRGEGRPRAERSEFKPRGEGKPRAERSEFKPRGEFKPRAERTEFKPRGEGRPRAERSEFKPRGESKPRAERSEFKPRGEGKPRAERSEFKPRGDFAPRGGKPGGRPGGKPGGRPGGKPGGRPPAKGPRGPRTPR